MKIGNGAGRRKKRRTPGAVKDNIERTVFARSCAVEHEVIARIPWSRVITVKQARETPLGRIAQTLPETKGIDLISCWLVTAYLSKGRQGSENAELFMRTLPTINDLRHIPAFWSKEDMDSLAGSHVGKEAIKRNVKCSQYARNLIKACEACELDSACMPTPELWRWANTLAKSRTFTVPNFNSKQFDEEFPWGCCLGEYTDDEEPDFGGPEDDLLIMVSITICSLELKQTYFRF